MIYIQLFLSFLQIGAFSFGGGYAAMPLIQSQIVDLHHWLDFKEFTDLITISQMTPGPIAINSATFVGTKIAGIPGAIAATLGCILPSCILVTIIAYFYLKYRHLRFLQNILNYLRPAVVALIATAGVTIMISALFGSEATILLNNFSIHQLIIFLFCVFMLWYKKSNPIFVMILSGILNVIYQTII
ncbi:chromate transporter [Catenibacterium mitsuokai]|uniref:chromate transporter n=1 Tax=Catenibacterium mitsuokai TaxID=100886 RepID=UPI0022E67857|nr:chromate transporter [Catenibacterium mitsuokai]